MFVKYMLNPLTFLPPFFFGFTKHFVPKSVQDGHMVVGFGNDSKEGIRSISYVFVTDVEAIGIRNVCTAIFLCVFFTIFIIQSHTLCINTNKTAKAI